MKKSLIQVEGVFKASALEDLNEYRQAIEAYDRTILINPNDKYSWNGKGRAFEKLGEYNKALEAYNRAIAIDSNFESAKENRDRLITKMPKQTPYTTPFRTPYTMPSTTPSTMPYIVISGIGTIIGLVIVVKAYRSDKQHPEP